MHSNRKIKPLLWGKRKKKNLKAYTIYESDQMLCLREKVFKTIIINMLIRAKGEPGNRYNARDD